MINKNVSNKYCNHIHSILHTGCLMNLKLVKIVNDRPSQAKNISCKLFILRGCARRACDYVPPPPMCAGNALAVAASEFAPLHTYKRVRLSVRARRSSPRLVSTAISHLHHQNPPTRPPTAPPAKYSVVSWLENVDGSVSV